MSEQNKYLFAVPFYLELFDPPYEQEEDVNEDDVPTVDPEESVRLLREHDEYEIFEKCAQIAANDWNNSKMQNHFFVDLIQRDNPVKIGMYKSTKNKGANYVLIQFLFEDSPLYNRDQETLRNWLEGQMSDGWGESFEQTSIGDQLEGMEGTEVYMHFWWDRSKDLDEYDIRFIRGNFIEPTEDEDLIEEAYDPQQVAIANKTSRSGGASALAPDGSIRSVVARWVMENVDKSSSILDFGAGSQAVQTHALRDAGFKNVTAYDFGSNVKDGVHDPEALNRAYDVVFASNVVNTASSEEMIIETIKDILRATKSDGISIFNYPATPRKTGMSSNELKSFIQDTLGVWLILVGGTNSTPIWKIEV